MFKLKKKNNEVKKAIEFMKSQKKLNRLNIEKIKDLKIDVSELEDWDKMYDRIIKLLKSID